MTERPKENTSKTFVQVKHGVSQLVALGVQVASQVNHYVLRAYGANHWVGLGNRERYDKRGRRASIASGGFFFTNSSQLLGEVGEGGWGNRQIRVEREIMSLPPVNGA